jgi:dolichyl-phosphate beta-glucosyltransferase
MPSLVIIIPCYNEAQRLEPLKFIEFSKRHPTIQFCFVNDGSTDDTLSLLNTIAQATTAATVVSLPKNKGKGEAVRQGMKKCLETNCDFIGYLDADLSTSLEEFYELHLLAGRNNADIVIGSRVKKADTVIERSFLRHITGRMIATIVDQKFKLGIYDTQCGAKLFNANILNGNIEQPFQTKWFFDVELLWRVKNKNQLLVIREIPLQEWRNVKNSKITILSFPLILKELYTLLTRY